MCECKTCGIDRKLCLGGGTRNHDLTDVTVRTVELENGVSNVFLLEIELFKVQRFSKDPRSDLQHRCKSAYPYKIFDLTYSTVSRYCVKKLPPLTRLTVDQPYRNWGRIGIVGHKSMRITHTYLTKTSGRGDALAGKLAARYAERLSG
mgnify:CR=1